MVTTVAPTIPVDAPSNMPTRVTEIAKPPGLAPNAWVMVLSRSSATFERSNITPRKTNKGTATSTSLDMTAKMRCGKA